MNFERKEETATDVSIPGMTGDNDDNNWWRQHCSFPNPDPDPTHRLLSEPHRPDWRRWGPHSQEVVPLPAARCSLNLVTRPLYLQRCRQDAISELTLPSTWLSKAEAVQVPVLKFLNKRKTVLCVWLEECRFDPSRIFWEGQGNLRTLDKHNSWFHCGDCSCLLVIYSTRILNKTDLACEKVATRKVWNAPTHESWKGENHCAKTK